MIRKIGVLCQDRNSFGFLDGLKRRLKCDAELVEPTTGGLAKSSRMTSRQARLAVADLRNKGIDLVVRFTDADRNRWQDIHRHEVAVFPDDAESILVCGVAVDNVELWLALDRRYIEEQLDLSDTSQMSDRELTGAIKHALPRKRDPNEPVSEVTARLVADAPPDVFQRWLNADDALRSFYQDCRKAAIRADCEVPNELDKS